MPWLVEANAALADAARLAVELRADVPNLDAARERCASLLLRLDRVVELGAVAYSKRADPPATALKDDNDQDWEGPSFRYSPPV